MHSRKTAPLALALLSGCTLIPAYHRPALPVAAHYPAAAGVTAAGPQASDIGWKNFFADPALGGLIALSLANNRNLRVTSLDVIEAQAQYRVDRASLFPVVDATGGLQASRTPGNIETGGGSSALEGGAGGAALNYRAYSLGIGAVSWELDFFGKLRSQARAAQETYLSDADTALSAKISLIAQISAEYYTWLADRESLGISQDTVAAQQHSLDLTQMAVSAGADTGQDLAQAQTTVDTAEANQAQYARQVAQMNAVPGLDASRKLADVPAGLPSDLLERRPDIRAAEHALLSANANIGAARAAFFPSITLTANAGRESPGLNSLFSAGQGSFLFEPSISLPIFAGGANLANLDIEIANYENTIQSAFHDAADALSARATYVAQVRAEQNLVNADNRYYQLANMRFKAGIDNYLNVLVAENSLLSARLTLVSLKLAAQQNEITLYKALGGGWQDVSAPAPALP
jgi:multidrug efflux system outer membrane protein